MAFHLRHRQEWRLRGAFEDYLVLAGAQLLSDEQARRVPEGLMAFQVERWMGDTFSRRVLFDIYEALGGVWVPLGMTVLEQQQVHERIKVQLVDAFRSERLVALYGERYYLSPPLPPRLPRPAASPSPAEQFVATSWIALRLEDEDGTALARQRYRLKLADGSIREGVSGPDGFVRLDGIPEGPSTVEFPGVDAGDWRAA